MTLLTIRGASERLGVGYSTLKRWIHAGTVRTTRTEGGHHRITEEEVERLSARGDAEGRRQPAVAVESGLAELSARNRLRGFVEEVRIDGLLAQVRLRVGDQRLTAVITADAVRALRLRRGDDAVAIIKSTEVMIGRLATDAGSSHGPGQPARQRRRHR